MVPYCGRETMGQVQKLGSQNSLGMLRRNGFFPDIRHRVAAELSPGKGADRVLLRTILLLAKQGECQTGEVAVTSSLQAVPQETPHFT